MKNMSFAMTTRQMCERTKSVTRRVGWLNAEIGDQYQPIEKGQGIPKGGHVTYICGPIVVEGARRERLNRMTEDLEYGRREVILEGFPDMEPAAFVEMVAKANRIDPHDFITRIEFSFVKEPSA